MKKKDSFQIPKSGSSSTGIYFHSKRYKGYYALATVDEDGNIKTEWTNAKCEKTKLGFKGWLNIILTSVILYFISFLITTMTIFLMFQNFNYGVRFMCAFLSIMFLIRFIFVTYVDRKDGTAKFRYALHLALNAYEDLKRLPRLGELLKYSRFRSYRSTNKDAFTIFIFAMLFVYTLLPSFGSTESYILFFIWAFILLFTGIHYRNGGFNFAQVFTTKRCTVKELEVAVAGLKTWIENEYQD